MVVLFCFSFLSSPASVHIDVVCCYLSLKKQITMSDQDYPGRPLLCKVQLLFSFWGLVQHSAYGCVGLKPVKSLAEIIKYLSALLDRSQKWSAVCKTITRISFGSLLKYSSAHIYTTITFLFSLWGMRIGIYCGILYKMTLALISAENWQRVSPC